MRLIDLDAIPKSAWRGEKEDLIDELILAPTVDAVPVVRCGECKLHDNCYTEDVFKFAGLNDDSRFCGVGERKGGDE